MLTGLIKFIVVYGYTYMNFQSHIDCKALKLGLLGERPAINRLRPASKRGRLTDAECTRSMKETTKTHLCVGHSHRNYTANGNVDRLEDTSKTVQCRHRCTLRTFNSSDAAGLGAMYVSRSTWNLKPSVTEG